MLIDLLRSRIKFYVLLAEGYADGLQGNGRVFHRYLQPTLTLTINQVLQACISLYIGTAIKVEAIKI